jgi:hypothetical protein
MGDRFYASCKTIHAATLPEYRDLDTGSSQLLRHGYLAKLEVWSVRLPIRVCWRASKLVVPLPDAMAGCYWWLLVERKEPCRDSVCLALWKTTRTRCGCTYHPEDAKSFLQGTL